MATRRPKVPRATPAAPKSPDTGDGGDVIQAVFGSSRGTRQDQAGNAAPAPRTPGQQAGNTGTAGAATTPSAATPSGAPSAAAHQKAAKPNPARKGTAKAGASSGPASVGSAAPAEEHPVPAKAFSGRMLALLVVMIAITIMLAPTIKIFFELPHGDRRHGDCDLARSRTRIRLDASFDAEVDGILGIRDQTLTYERMHVEALHLTGALLFRGVDVL